ncbi:MAG: hypothetical protein K6G83_15470 [Lachnospiraceae bacterium]|nr:hypothetical protein [Lachnospiraceae bacterium]
MRENHKIVLGSILSERLRKIWDIMDELAEDSEEHKRYSYEFDRIHEIVRENGIKLDDDVERRM